MLRVANLPYIGGQGAAGQARRGALPVRLPVYFCAFRCCAIPSIFVVESHRSIMSGWLLRASRIDLRLCLLNLAQQRRQART